MCVDVVKKSRAPTFPSGRYVSFVCVAYIPFFNPASTTGFKDLNPQTSVPEQTPSLSAIFAGGSGGGGEESAGR